MKIRITQASDKNWYRNMIGKVFEVHDDDDERYFVRRPERTPKLGWGVNKDNCEVVQEG